MKNILENGDFIVEDSNLIPVGYLENVRNDLACVFNTWKGEWFLNPELGIDYETFFDKSTSEEKRRFIIMDGISQVDEITQIKGIDIQIDNRIRKATIFVDAMVEDLELTTTFEIGGV